MEKAILFFTLVLGQITLAQSENHFVTQVVLPTNAILIDVRTPEEFNEGTIENAINIDFFDDNFKNEVSKIDKDSEIIIFCKSGGRSAQANEILKSLGFNNVREIQGGYDEYTTNKSE